MCVVKQKSRHRNIPVPGFKPSANLGMLSFPSAYTGSRKTPERMTTMIHTKFLKQLLGMSAALLLAGCSTLSGSTDWTAEKVADLFADGAAYYSIAIKARET